MAKLPFEITARHTSGNAAMFIAAVDGESVTSERYTIGNGDRRRKVAERWSNDGRLCRPDSVGASDIEAKLEEIELRTKDSIDSVDEDGGSRPTLERASYADDSVIVELAWNSESAAADFIVFDRTTREITRVQQLKTPIGIIVPAVVCRGIVTPGPGIEGAVLLPRAFSLFVYRFMPIVLLP